MTLITKQVIHKHPSYPDAIWHDQYEKQYQTIYTPDGNTLCESIDSTRVEVRLLQMAARVGRTHRILAENSFQSNVISLASGRTQRADSQQRIFFDFKGQRVLVDELHPQWKFTEISGDGVKTVKHREFLVEEIYFVRSKNIEPRMPWNRQPAALRWSTVRELFKLDQPDWKQFTDFIVEQTVGPNATLVLTEADCTDWGHRGKEYPEMQLTEYTGRERPGNQTVAEALVRLFTITAPQYSTRATTAKFDTSSNIIWLPPKREFSWTHLGTCRGPRVIFYPGHWKFAEGVFCGGRTPENVFLVHKPLPTVLELYKECPEFEVQFQALYFHTLQQLLQNVNSDITGPVELRELLKTVLTNPAS